jgi:hypothetical protein
VPFDAGKFIEAAVEGSDDSLIGRGFGGQAGIAEGDVPALAISTASRTQWVQVSVTPVR